jgi:hypothetical protein
MEKANGPTRPKARTKAELLADVNQLQTQLRHTQAEVYRTRGRLQRCESDLRAANSEIERLGGTPIVTEDPSSVA